MDPSLSNKFPLILRLIIKELKCVNLSVLNTQHLYLYISKFSSHLATREQTAPQLPAPYYRRDTEFYPQGFAELQRINFTPRGNISNIKFSSYAFPSRSLQQAAPRPEPPL